MRKQNIRFPGFDLNSLFKGLGPILTMADLESKEISKGPENVHNDKYIFLLYHCNMFAFHKRNI